MAGWTADELSKIERADELQIASCRPDGSLRPFVTIWVVRSGDELFVRSAYGHENGWFRRAVASGSGRIRAGGVERDVAFDEPDASIAAAITAAYHSKYDRYGPAIVDPVVSAESVRSTLRLLPVGGIS